MNKLILNFYKKYLTRLIILTLLLGGMSLNAQILNKGNFLIGGTLGFSSSNSDVDQTVSGQQSAERAVATQFNVAPSIGYFFTDNFALGFGLDYTLNSVEREDISSSLDSDLLFGPFLRYYLPVGDDKAFFLETNFGYGNSVDEVTLDDQTQNIATNVFAIGVGPGFTIFSSDAIGIETGIKYNYARSDADATVGGESFMTQTTTNQIDFSVGLQFYFDRVSRATN